MVINMSFFENDLVFLIPEFYLFSVILVLLFVGVIYDRYAVTLGQKVIVLVSKLSILGLVFTLLLYCNQLGLYGYIVNYKFIRDELSYLFLILVILGSIIVILLKIDYLLLDKIVNYEYIILMLLSVLGINLLIISNDFLMLYLSLELQSLCFYIMVGFKQNSDYSTEAGLKYFIYGAFASGVFLLGISLLYGIIGLLNFTDLLYFYYEGGDLLLDKGVLLSFLFIFIGLFFKIGAAPFHGWLPDIYEGSSIMVTAFFAIVPKIAVFCVLLRLIYEVLVGVSILWLNIFLVGALLSLIIGIFMSLVQVSLKRLMGYSAVSHTGFLLLGFLALNKEGLFSILLYIIIYYILMINFFSIFMVLRQVSTHRMQLSILKLHNLYQGNKALAICLSVVLFSIIGLPPLAGFYSKLYIFTGLVAQYLYEMAVVCILLSGVAVLYYLKIIRYMLFGEGFFLNYIYGVPFITANIISFTTLSSIYYNFYALPLMYLLKNIVILFYV